jgi:plasmid stabilization system protein ParE
VEAAGEGGGTLLDRRQARRLADLDLEDQTVDLAHPPLFGIDELLVEHVADQVHQEPPSSSSAADTACRSAPVSCRRESRAAHLSRIHYQLYYRVDADVVEVLALWHDARGSAPDL